MGPSRIHTGRRRRGPSALLLCWLVLAWGPLAGQSPTPPDESPAEEPAPAPRLVVDSKEVDLGRLVRGEQAEAVFTLRNEGDAVLRILRVKPG